MKIWPSRRALFGWGTLGAVTGLAVIGVHLAEEWYYSPSPAVLTRILGLALCFVYLPSAAAMAIILLIPRAMRKVSVVLLVSSIACEAVVLPGILLFAPVFHDSMRRTTLRNVANRAAVVIEAVERYEDLRGQPPGKLDALIPEFLPAIPETGIVEHQEYRYAVTVGKSPTHMYGNSWILYVHIGFEFVFAYFPQKNYPEDWERIRNWGYTTN